MGFELELLRSTSAWTVADVLKGLDELLDAALMIRRVGPRLIGRREDADLVLLDDAPILIARGDPDMSQVVHGIVFVLDRILVN